MSTAALIAAGISTAAKFAADYVKSRRDEKRYKQELSDARANWRLQNEYNSPESQMKRLKAAGLNPNLVYQQGGALSGAGEISNPSHADSPLSDYSSIASMALQTDSALAAIENTKANTDKTKQETYNLTKTNEEMDRTLGQLKGATLLNQEERDYYASLFGVDPNNVQDLSVRGASILNDLRYKFKNNKQLDQIITKLSHESNSAMYNAATARFAMLAEMMNLDTEAHLRGYGVSYNHGTINGDSFSRITEIFKNPESLDYVLNRFMRELKEVGWQSSDAKHIIDSTSQILGSLPKLKFSSTPEEYYRKHKK